MADFSFVLSFSRASGLQGLGKAFFPTRRKNLGSGKTGLGFKLRAFGVCASCLQCFSGSLRYRAQGLQELASCLAQGFGASCVLPASTAKGFRAAVIPLLQSFRVRVGSRVVVTDLAHLGALNRHLDLFVFVWGGGVLVVVKVYSSPKLYSNI